MIPTVSVIIPLYNHESYIEDCIKSVLNQTFQDFEIIITDDYSNDRSVEIVESFHDPRIKLLKNLNNLGGSVTANRCILNSTGKYIAMLSSDDIWHPQKLEMQINYLEKHSEIGVVFSQVEWIDKNGNVFEAKKDPYFSVFNVNNRNRYDWLNYFFYKGNCLCHPSSVVRRECYNEVGLLNPAFSGLPDFDLWIRICLHYEIWILEEKLVRFRWLGNERNASGDNDINRIRNSFEAFLILDQYLQIKDIHEVLSIFPESTKYGKINERLIPYILGRIAIDSGVVYKILWGQNVLYKILQNEDLTKYLDKENNFSYLRFTELISKNDVFKVNSYIPLGSIIQSKGIRKILLLFIRYSKKFISWMHNTSH